MNFKYRYSGDKIYLELYDSYTLPQPNDTYSSSKDTLLEYDDLTINYKRVFDLSEYPAGDYTSSDVGSVTAECPASVDPPKKSKKVNLATHVEVHWFDSSINQLDRIYSVAGDYFYEQYAAKLFSRIDLGHEYKKETDFTMNKDVHGNALNFSTNRSTIEYKR